MKSLSFLVLLLLSVFATNVFAEDEVNILGGYTSLNNVAIARADEIVNFASSAVGSNNTNNAFTIDLDYFFAITKIVKPGFRIGFSETGASKIISHVPILRQHYLKNQQTGERRWLGEEYCAEDQVLLCSLFSFSLMFGGKVNYDISEEFSLNWKLFGGIVIS